MSATYGFVTAQDIMQLTGVSKSAAYRLIIQLNEELTKMGCITFRGRVNKMYFDERVYGKEILEHASLQRQKI